jgi:hypothetical protein
MPQYFTIPLQVGTPQSRNVQLGGVDYRITLKYRNVDQGGWILDIDDTSGNSILAGIPLVTGADLLAQYPDKAFGGSLYVQTTSDPDAVPTFENLGDDALIYWVTP